MNYLKGSQKIVYDALRDLLQDGKQPSINALSHITHYHPRTVKRSISALKELGLVSCYQERPGVAADYRILTEVDTL